jgi:ubiquinone/menaquinone biosynthesis C-methylase UbiE
VSLSLSKQNAYRTQYRARYPGWHPATEVYENTIRAKLIPDARVLDLGCGRGGVLEQLNAPARPIGLDPDLESLREYRLPGTALAQAMAGRLPLKDSSVDMIVCSWVFEHLDLPLQVLSEAQRALRPGGSLIFLTPNANSLVVLLNRALRPWQRVLVPRLYGRADADTFPVRYRANTTAQIRSLAKQAGLSCELLQQIHDPTYLAFTPLLFRVSMALTRFTPPVHLVGVLTRA